MDTCGLVIILTLEILQCLGGTDVGDTSTRKVTFLYSGTGGVESILNPVLLLLHLHLGVGTDIEHGHTASQFSQALLQLLLVVRALRVGNLVLELSHTLLDVLLRTSTIDDGGVVLGDRHLLGRTQFLERGLVERQTLVLADHHTTSQHGDILQHGLAAVAEARSLDGADLQASTQTVDNQRGESLRIDILGDHQQRTATLGSRLQDGQEVLDVADLLVVDEDVRILHHTLHLVRIGHEVARQVAAVKLHTLYHTDVGVARLALLDGDHTVLAHLAHGVGQQLTDLRVVVGTHRSDLLDLVVVVTYHLGVVLDVVHHRVDGLVDTTFQVHRVGTSSDVLQTLVDDGLGENRSRGRTITCVVARLAGHALGKLCACVLQAVLQLYLLGHAHTVLGDLRCAKLSANHHVATLRAECHLDGVGQLVHTALEQIACFCIEFNIFCHDRFFCFYLINTILQLVASLTTSLLGDDGEHIALAHHEVLRALVLNLRASILAIKHHVVGFQDHLLVLRTLADGNHLAALRFLFGGVGNNDSTHFLLCRCRKNQHSVC